ncbi:hypothetical protein BDA96_03G409400 [Sorghum bicolor]|uniref:Uncharacterized protein n=2 Tax=Sorghum bicolor TaxID=4558 RepID=A0A921RJB9_SORBI|nr:hypothetical protein BDA96_03G409400 [Sorghum bicolor]KXG33827.2 hypothetical protein SORBI_3003G379301 [Sorghum bicolor]
MPTLSGDRRAPVAGPGRLVATPSRPDRRGALLRSTKSMARHRGRGRITIMPSASALSRRRIARWEIRNQTRPSWFVSHYTCDIRYVSAQDADILKILYL